MNSIIIITPRNHIAEIRRMMTEEDESLSMSFEDVRSRVYTCYFQIGINKIISMYSDTKAVYLYGYNFLSILLLCSFLENGYEAALVLPSDTACEIKRRFSNTDIPYITGDMLPRDISPYILLTQKVSDWRPDYYVASDPGVSKWKNDIGQLESKAIFLSDVIDIENDISDKIYRWHLIYADEDKDTFGFSDDFSIGGYTGCTVVYDGCLQLAVYMGFEEIYLLGVDNCNYGKDDCGHFFAGYRTGGQKECLLVDRTTLAYQSAKAYADAHGIKIYNATRGGALEVFERVDFDSLFEKAAEGK